MGAAAAAVAAAAAAAVVVAAAAVVLVQMSAAGEGEVAVHCCNLRLSVQEYCSSLAPCSTE